VRKNDDLHIGYNLTFNEKLSFIPWLFLIFSLFSLCLNDFFISFSVRLRAALGLTVLVLASWLVPAAHVAAQFLIRLVLGPLFSDFLCGVLILAQRRFQLRSCEKHARGDPAGAA
jgi:hypothetical protein